MMFEQMQKELPWIETVLYWVNRIAKLAILLMVCYTLFDIALHDNSLNEVGRMIGEFGSSIVSGFVDITAPK